MRRFRSLSVCALGLALLFFAAGCGGPKLVPVEGKIMVGTQPLTKGEVTFHPDVEGGNKEKYPDLPRGKLDSNGKYSLTTGGKAGAPAGKYKVTVNPAAGEAPADYSIPKAIIDASNLTAATTSLKAEVKADASAGAYDFTVQPAK